MSTNSERYAAKLKLVRRLRKRHYTFTEIGVELGVTRQRAHQLYREATKQ